MTLGQLREAMPEAELLIWHGFFTLQREDEQKAMDKARRGR
jgi:hypothetical protein